MRKRQKLAMEGAYQEPGKAPWIPKRPPQELIDLVEKRFIVPPARVLDVGCGEGQIAVYLAQQGFDVTGVDLSSNAIRYARRYAAESGVQDRTRFHSLDAVRHLHQLAKKPVFEPFDFVLEWGLLHFMIPSERVMYVKQLAELVRAGASYLSLSFSDQAEEWGGKGTKYRVSSLTGAELYYSSLGELQELFSPYFNIRDARDRSTVFDNSPFRYTHHVLWMERKG